MFTGANTGKIIIRTVSESPRLGTPGFVCGEPVPL
jgi:hypothetical protein